MARRPPWICSFPRALAAALPQPSLTSLRQRRVRGVSSQPGGSHIGSDTFSSARKGDTRLGGAP